jgi:endonuclease YncB( thermonuclease family)
MNLRTQGAAMGFAAALAAAAAGATAADRLEGEAEVIDGDSLTIVGRPINLFGVTAPRFNQQCRDDRVSWSCGREAKRALDRLVSGHVVICEIVPGSDEPALARCAANGLDLAEAMVERGLAVSWTDPPDYVGVEQQARVLRIGIWKGGDIDPWLWRPSGG